MTVFYDAAYWQNLPHGKLACFYADGIFAATAADVAKISPPDLRWITVTGNGRIASIIDGKPDNPLSPAQVRGFVRDRRAASQDAIIYCPRSWVGEYQQVLYDFGNGSLGEYDRLFWWIATLDGYPWTPAELAADIAAHWDAEIDPSRIWANQNNQIPQLGPSATADESQLFLSWQPALSMPCYGSPG